MPSSWETIAEVYRSREHSLINTVVNVLSSWQSGELTDTEAVKMVNQRLATHFRETGRNPEVVVPLKPVTPVTEDVRAELLKLLGENKSPTKIIAKPPEPNGSKPDGVLKVRKERSDKGKPRGKYGPRKQKG